MAKLIQVELAALTRVCYGAIVEVPDDFDESDNQAVVDLLYDQTDGGEFHDDTDCWEKGECRAEDAVTMQDDPQPTHRVVRDPAEPYGIRIEELNQPNDDSNENPNAEDRS